MSGRRVARPAETKQTGPGLAEDVAGATRDDLSGLRADLLRSQGPSPEAGWPDDGPAWQQGTSTWSQGAPTLWVEDPVSAPGAHGPVDGDSLHPDDLAVLHGLPEPERAPEPSDRPATRAQRRETHRGSADGLSLWSDPEEDAPDRGPAPRAREDRARAPRWAVVLAAVLALLVGAALTALVTEGQVRSARQETAEAVSAAEDARESANQARIALQESEALTELTAPEPRDPEPFDEGALEDGAATAAPSRPLPRSTRATEERPRESAPAAGPSGVGSPDAGSPDAAAADAAVPDAASDQGTRPGRSAAGPTGSSEKSAAADDAGCLGDPGSGGGGVDGVGGATGGDGGDTCP